MLRNLTLICLLWLIGRFVYGVNFGAVHGAAMAFCASHRMTITGSGILGALGLIGVSLGMRELGYYSLMFVVGKIFFWGSQLAVSLVSFASVVFWFDLHVNLWADLGVAAVVPFVALGGAAVSLHLFDFNYPVKETMLRHVGLAAVSLAVVWIAALAGL